MSSFQPAQSCSAMPSSIVMIGYCAHQPARKSTNCSDVRRLPSPVRLYLPFSKNSLEATSRPSSTSSPALVAGLADRFEDGFQRFLVRTQVRREAAFVADRRAQAAALQHRLQRVEDLGAGAQRFGERIEADRQHHEFLQVDVVVGMRAAVDDVHHRHRQFDGRAVRPAASTAASCARRRPRARSPATRRAARSRPGGPCSRCRRGRSGGGRALPGRGVETVQRIGDRRVDVGDGAFFTPLPR